MYDLKITNGGGSIFTGPITFHNQGVYLSKMDASGSNGCVLPVINGTFSTDNFPSAAASFPNTGITITDSAWIVGKSPITGVKDTIVCKAISGIQYEKSAVTLKLFPNPTSGIFILNYPDETPGTSVLNIYDMAGKIVHNELIYNTNSEINLHLLAPGIYYVRLSTSNRILQQKLIKN
jgi:hypothetical protein